MVTILYSVLFAQLSVNDDCFANLQLIFDIKKIYLGYLFEKLVAQNVSF